jgi:hypothetical protein
MPTSYLRPTSTREGVVGVSRTCLLSATVVLGLVAASFAMAALLVAVSQKAEAAFPGRNGVIAFGGTPDRDGSNYQIFRIRPDGSGVKTLTTHAEGYSILPVWSPNGKKIAYDRTTNDYTPDGEIYLMNADGTGKVNLTKDRHPVTPLLP